MRVPEKRLVVSHGFSERVGSVDVVVFCVLLKGLGRLETLKRPCLRKSTPPAPSGTPLPPLELHVYARLKGLEHAILILIAACLPGQDGLAKTAYMLLMPAASPLWSC